MSQGALTRGAWLRYWAVMQRYHRYEVQGLEHLRGGPALLIGYHGRVVARDLCMLSVEIHRRLGYLPHVVANQLLLRTPYVRALTSALGFVAGDHPSLEAAVRRGEHLLVTPGGVREAARSFRARYRVDWGQRTGYLRLALRYRLPLIPIGASGVDDAFFGLNDGYRLGRRLGAPAGLPPYLALGPLGPWPLSPPFPVKIRQRIGAPIHLDPDLDPADQAGLLRWHERVTRAVQQQIDLARNTGHPPCTPSLMTTGP